MPKSWKAGDKVKLASGGPEMTVVRQPTSGPGAWTYCQWFDKSGNLKNGRFAADSLVESTGDAQDSGDE